MEDGAHVGMFTMAIMGHLVPFCALAKRLYVDFNCKITFIVANPRSFSAQAPDFLARLRQSCPEIKVVTLEIPLQGDPRNIESAEILARQCLRPVKEKLLQSTDLRAFVTSIYCARYVTEMSDAGISSYVFSTTNAAFVRFVLQLPELMGKLQSGEFDDEMPLPGLPGVLARDLPLGFLKDRTGADFRFFWDAALHLPRAAGVLVNSFEALEQHPAAQHHRNGTPEANPSQSVWTQSHMNHNAEEERKTPPIYLVGPLLQEYNTDKCHDGSGERQYECIKWLDQQPPRSVVVVGFGSWADLSLQQLHEVAHGLQNCGHRFLWLLPNAEHHAEAEKRLWQEAEAAAAVRGIVVREWVPQMRVLEHSATAAFARHCGWNPTLESVCCGVPLIPWPLSSVPDHAVNALLVVRAFGVGVELRRGADGFVRAEHLVQAVHQLMDNGGGQRRRCSASQRTLELQQEAQRSVKPGGPSWNAMAQLVSLWTHHQ